MKITIVGGGAAGFFAAIRAAELNPDAKVQILERGKEVLAKVRVSGGGRCNLTHACFNPKELVKYYQYHRMPKQLLIMSKSQLTKVKYLFFNLKIFEIFNFRV